ncbi:MAG: hypothetical protein ABSA80_04140 [Terriglobales bacterium]|jgi:integrase
MTFTIFRRHNRETCDSKNRYDPRCGCPLHVQFVWKSGDAVFEGKKLTYQNKWSLETRSWSEAQGKAKDLEKRLKDFADGKVSNRGISVEDAVKEWWALREQNKLNNIKAKLMGQKLIDWSEANGVLMLSALTTDRVMKWRLTLPFRTGDSSSLKVHWSVINGFFNWCEGMGYVDKSPAPNPKQFPQFAITYDKPEVVPPTKKQIEKVIATATGRVKLLAQLMRETGMALVDAQKFDPANLEDGTLIRSKRTKTTERYRVRIPSSLAKQLDALGSPAFPGTYREWRERLYKVFREAGVEMTPHGFRHFRISEWLAQGVSVADVSKWVGTSEKEIRKTYEHWIKEAEDRLDEVQKQAWLAQGLDENGNKKPVN